MGGVPLFEEAFKCSDVFISNSPAIAMQPSAEDLAVLQQLVASLQPGALPGNGQLPYRPAAGVEHAGQHVASPSMVLGNDMLQHLCAALAIEPGESHVFMLRPTHQTRPRNHWRLLQSCQLLPIDGLSHARRRPLSRITPLPRAIRGCVEFTRGWPSRPRRGSRWGEETYNEKVSLQQVAQAAQTGCGAGMSYWSVLSTLHAQAIGRPATAVRADAADTVAKLQQQVETLQSQLQMKNFELQTLKDALGTLLSSKDSGALSTRSPSASSTH